MSQNAHGLTQIAISKNVLLGYTAPMPSTSSPRATQPTASPAAERTSTLAATPPMGWNSFDCYDLMVTEEDVIGNAEYMARHLKKHGYEYIVVDMAWYDPLSAPWGRSNAPYEIDAYGRLLPCPVKFPSAAGGAGFKPLADRIHALGLKFGIHIMRGISRQAVNARLPILGTSYNAADVANKANTCVWWEGSWGVDPSHPAAAAWYASNVRLFAEWGVDFIKADDMSCPYWPKEVELLRQAIDGCGREMVLSLSPGEAPVAEAAHLKKHANMWRISGDFWDNWPQLYKMFDLLHAWEGHSGPGHWPDADMLPLGYIRIRRSPALPPHHTHFTPDEQRTLMTLWCIARSPLMFGGDMRVLDPGTFALITHPEVLHMLRTSSRARQVMREGYRIAWTARAENGGTYLALFNTSPQGTPELGIEETHVGIALASIDLTGNVQVRDVWARADLGTTSGFLNAHIPAHGARLFLLTPTA